MEDYYTIIGLIGSTTGLVLLMVIKCIGSLDSKTNKIPRSPRGMDFVERGNYLDEDDVPDLIDLSDINKKED